MPITNEAINVFPELRGARSEISSLKKKITSQQATIERMLTILSRIRADHPRAMAECDIAIAIAEKEIS